MGKTVHVLNGDAILPIFEKSGIQGDVVIWRELLCDGPLDAIVASDDFWKKRYVFFENEIGVAKLEYFDKTIKEIIKLEDLAEYIEVVLWFEFDLFCQVNLIALCSYLLQNYRKDVAYYLVCTGKVRGKEKFQSLTDFTSEEFRKLYENKLKITKNNLTYAKESWEVYVKNNEDELKAFDFSKCSKFKYLQLAINQHLLRFPAKTGLNQIDSKILEIINYNVFSEKEIIRNLLAWQQENTIYGFGDLQYLRYLKKLKKHYTIKDSKYYSNKKNDSISN